MHLKGLNMDTLIGLTLPGITHLLCLLIFALKLLGSCHQQE